MLLDAIRSVFSRTAPHAGFGRFQSPWGQARRPGEPARDGAGPAPADSSAAAPSAFDSTAPGIFGILAGGDR